MIPLWIKWMTFLPPESNCGTLLVTGDLLPAVFSNLLSQEVLGFVDVLHAPLQLYIYRLVMHHKSIVRETTAEIDDLNVCIMSEDSYLCFCGFLALKTICPNIYKPMFFVWLCTH